MSLNKSILCSKFSKQHFQVLLADHCCGSSLFFVVVDPTCQFVKDPALDGDLTDGDGDMTLELAKSGMFG
jgi:hypothetical protein